MSSAIVRFLLCQALSTWGSCSGALFCISSIWTLRICFASCGKSALVPWYETMPSPRMTNQSASWKCAAECCQHSLALLLQRHVRLARVGNEKDSGLCLPKVTFGTKEVFDDSVLRLAIKGAKRVVQKYNLAASVHGSSQSLQRLLIPSCQNIRNVVGTIPLVVVVLRKDSGHGFQSWYGLRWGVPRGPRQGSIVEGLGRTNLALLGRSHRRLP